MTKMIRPCTLWGKTFDALCVNDIIRDDKLENRKKFDFNVALYSLGNHFIIYSPYVQTRKEQDALFQEAITAIYEALNAPVRITQEVLEAAKKEYLDDSYYYRVDENARFSTDETFLRNVNPIHLLGMEILPACPLSLDFLLQFYTDGTPVKEKETE